MYILWGRRNMIWHRSKRREARETIDYLVFEARLEPRLEEELNRALNLYKYTYGSDRWIKKIKKDKEGFYGIGL